MEITVTKTKTPKAHPAEDNLVFGKYFTDHMLLADYSEEKGWHAARIVPFGPLSIHPAATVLHYGSEIFEGLKAYRTPSGSVQLFRPRENIRRLNRSAERLGLPQIEEETMLSFLLSLVRLEKDWVPHRAGTSLYIRPFLFGNDESLGVHSIHRATLAVILSPVGAYYPQGLSPVKICIETEDVRAVRGGTGYAKCGGNYAASVRAAQKAEAQGFSQVLWLDGVQRKYIEEVGAMNVMFKLGDTVVTPKLTGSILPGITRDSCIRLLHELGCPVEERLLSAEELFAAGENGSLAEAFGTGTAAVISPIGLLRMNDREFTINHFEIGPLSRRLYDTLTGIQWGTLPDPWGWTMAVE